MGLDVCAASHTGHHRRNNQDVVLVDNDAGVFVVADGVGGQPGGEVASRIACEAAAAALRYAASRECPRDMHEAIRRANDSVRAVQRSEARWRNMATTLVAAATAGDTVVIGHVGDSRAYLFRSGVLARLTRDHSIEEEVRTLDPSVAALFGSNRNIISRAIGLELVAAADLIVQPLLPDDVILLCTDGVHGVISDQQIQAELEGATTAGQACDRLLSAVFAADAPDNVSVVVIRVASCRLSSSPF